MSDGPTTPPPAPEGRDAPACVPRTGRPAAAGAVSRRRSWLWTSLKIAVALAILAGLYFFGRLDFSRLHPERLQWGALALAAALGMEVEPLTGCVVMPLGLFLNMFGFAGGIGAGELGLGVLFEWLLRQPKEAGATLMLLFHAVNLVVKFAGLPFYVLEGRPKEEAPPA